MAGNRHRPLSTKNGVKKLRSSALDSEQLSYFNSSLTLDEAIAKFIDEKHLRNLRSTSINLYKKCLRYFAEWLEQTKPDVIYLNLVKKQHVDEYIKHDLNTLKLSPYTINGRIRILRAFFNYFVDSGDIKSSPLTKIKLLKTNSIKIRVYTDEQIQKLLNHCDTNSLVGFRDYCFIILALDTGMRVTELLATKIEDIDLTQRVIFVSSEVSKGRSSRPVPFSSYTATQIKELIRENHFHFPNNQYLFASIRGTQISTGSIRRKLRQLGEISGVNSEINVCPHNFRHTAATKMLKAGIDLYSLSKILGHQSIDMTRRYLTLTPKDLSVRHDVFSPIRGLRTKKI